MFLNSFLVAQTQKVLNIPVIENARIFNEQTINTDKMEMSPAYIQKEIAFITSNTEAEKDELINQNYFDIAYGIVDSTGFIADMAYFTDDINSKLHEGALVFDKNEDILYFTRIVVKESKGKNQDTAKMQIYAATIDEVYPLSFNTFKHNYCHPAMNEGGDEMIISTNISSESIGKYDFFSCSKIGSNFSQLSNLGDSINTEFNELYPVFSGDDVVFFASDRSGGYGGLDIYCAFRREGIWQKPVLLPEPINSIADDYSLTINQEGSEGYFSSNRAGGKGLDDIYKVIFSESIFKEEKVINLHAVSINVIEKLTFESIENAELTLLKVIPDKNNFNLGDYDIDLVPAEKQGDLIMKLSPKTEKVETYVSDAEGNIELKVEKGGTYIFSFRKEGFESQDIYFDDKVSLDLTIALEPKDRKIIKEPEIFIPTAKGETVVFNNIYYEYNSAEIKGGATKELDALVLAMKQNPEMKILLASHTDARGKAAYNLSLSEKRALSAKKYLTQRGIGNHRISTIGYGESRIRNHCQNNITCTEAEHKYNRRTEVTIVD